MNLQDRMAAAETRVFKTVFLNTINHYDTLFGGTALALMDEIAFITATRFTRMRVVTVSSDQVDFTPPIPAGTLIELIGRVKTIGVSSLKIEVEVFVEEMYREHREKAVSGIFTFVALDERRKPAQILMKPAEEITQSSS